MPTRPLAIALALALAAASTGCGCPRTASGHRLQVNVELRLIVVPRDWLDEIYPGGVTPSGVEVRDDRIVLLSGADADLLIRSTQANRRTTSLSAPRITFPDGRGGRVAVSIGWSYSSFDHSPPDRGSGLILIEVTGSVTCDMRSVDVALRVRRPKVMPSDADFFGPVDPRLAAELRTIPEGVRSDPVRARGTLADKSVGLILAAVDPAEFNSAYEPGEYRLLLLVKPTILIENEKEEELFPGMIQGFGE